MCLTMIGRRGSTYGAKEVPIFSDTY
jgi:hypothetical protein